MRNAGRPGEAESAFPSRASSALALRAHLRILTASADRMLLESTTCLVDFRPAPALLPRGLFLRRARSPAAARTASPSPSLGAGRAPPPEFARLWGGGRWGGRGERRPLQLRPGSGSASQPCRRGVRAVLAGAASVPLPHGAAGVPHSLARTHGRLIKSRSSWAPVTGGRRAKPRLPPCSSRLPRLSEAGAALPRSPCLASRAQPQPLLRGQLGKAAGCGGPARASPRPRGTRSGTAGHGGTVGREKAGRSVWPPRTAPWGCPEQGPWDPPPHPRRTKPHPGPSSGRKAALSPELVLGAVIPARARFRSSVARALPGAPTPAGSPKPWGRHLRGFRQTLSGRCGL